ncbi:DgyrCDS3904 [Dimorphilus gyrociliatus]|uniref:DgyrCDS3904 n=1 Tax=Dimorphilus gyrociliatus TaxID=2664684 RepID=A0A7I8VGP2_9ANNE|nr:DgyrCDS3904 [Dimorphilus gyrociliatus]
MSLGYPSIRPRSNDQKIAEPTGISKNEYELPDRMFGSASVKSGLMQRHPLEESEKLWDKNQFDLNMAMLRNTQGISAPLKLTMERKFASKVGRLPCMRSSNVMMQTLNGSDETIDFDDILNTEPESAGNPHILVEKRLGLL